MQQIPFQLQLQTQLPVWKQQIQSYQLQLMVSKMQELQVLPQAWQPCHGHSYPQGQAEGKLSKSRAQLFPLIRSYREEV